MAQAFHADDVVELLDDGAKIGVVERTHTEVDTHQPYPAQSTDDVLTHDPSITKRVYKKFLKDGIPPPDTVVIQWHQVMVSSLLPISKLKLVDRSFLIGDVVKRNPQDAMSGVIINTSTRCALVPCSDFEVTSNRKLLKGLLRRDIDIDEVKSATVGGQPILCEIPASELRPDEAVNEEDLVIWRDHIGRIDELDTNLTVRLTDNSVVEVHESLVQRVDGGTDIVATGDIITARKASLRQGNWVYGQYNPNTPPTGTVVARRILTAEMTWLQRRIGAPESDDPDSTLDRNQLEADDLFIYDRTKTSKFTNSASPTLSHSEMEISLGSRVRFKDLTGASLKYDGSTVHGRLQRLDRNDTLGYDLNVFEVARFHTNVTVHWQNLSITQESSTDLIPDSSIDDENAAWPSEIAHTLDFSPVPGERGMTQPNKIGIVQSVDSVDRMATMRWCPQGRMQYFEDLDEEPGVKTLISAVLGTASKEQQELISMYDLEAPGALNVRRGDLVLLIKESESQRTTEPDWVGEVVDTCLDGTLIIRLGAMKEVRDIEVTREQVRVAVRSDGTDQMDQWDEGGEWNDEMSTSEEEDDITDDDMSEESDEELKATYEDENGVPLDEEDVEDGDWESDASQDDVDMIDAHGETPPTSHSVTPAGMEKERHDSSIITDAGMASTEPERYSVLEGPVPLSHHYCDEPSTESSLHLKRVQKEHRILRTGNALPSGVYVRTWESRLDLIRVLFIGPTETPYSNVPFVIDFYLSSSFPSEPPKAFFHSWTVDGGAGGVGRVNPNLYEDGKICLSLLGTWDGDKGEGWSPARSTLLQVLVSILGLVLVREPYFNEAGYEPLAGLESSRRPSTLYNERTFLRAGSFVIKAMEGLESPNGAASSGIEGLEDIVRWLYKDPDGRKLLEKKIRQAEEVLELSEKGSTAPDGMLAVSKGACIPLKRLLARLKELQTCRRQS